MAYIFITLIVAAIGAFIAVKLKIPAGYMIGSMVAVATFNILTSTAYLPAQAKIGTQIVSGLFIGCKINKNELYALKKSIKPAIINVVGIIMACLLMGVVMHKLTEYSLVTCAFACAPGSMVDMSIISIDMGADVAVVSVLQLVRLVVILSLYPTLFGVIIKKIGNKRVIEPKNDEKKMQRNRNPVLTIVVAVLAGMIGYFTHFPAAALIFSMIGVSVQNIVMDNAYMSISLKRMAQICAGALIGVSVNKEAITSIYHVFIPAIIITVGLILIVITLAFILYKTSDLDFVTALFACSPGGASDLSLIAEDYGANTPKVSIIQSARVVMVVVLYPILIQIIDSIL